MKVIMIISKLEFDIALSIMKYNISNEIKKKKVKLHLI